MNTTSINILDFITKNMIQEFECVMCRLIADNHIHKSWIKSWVNPLIYKGCSLCKAHFRYLLKNQDESVERFDREKATNAMEGLNY